MSFELLNKNHASHQLEKNVPFSIKANVFLNFISDISTSGRRSYKNKNYI